MHNVPCLVFTIVIPSKLYWGVCCCATRFYLWLKHFRKHHCWPLHLSIWISLGVYLLWSFSLLMQNMFSSLALVFSQIFSWLGLIILHSEFELSSCRWWWGSIWSLMIIYLYFWCYNLLCSDFINSRCWPSSQIGVCEGKFWCMYVSAALLFLFKYVTMKLVLPWMVWWSHDACDETIILIAPSAALEITHHVHIW